MKKLAKPIPIIIVVSILLLACNATNALTSQAFTQLSDQSNALQQTLSAPTLAASSPAQVVDQAAVPTPVALPTMAPVQSAPAVTNPEALSAYEGALEAIYDKVGPSVVNINVVSQSTGFPGGNGEALGSGFIWDAQGHIVTNNHVVDGASKIQVAFSDGSTYPADIVGTDPYSDLAVIKVNVPADLLKPVSMGDSTRVNVGQLAIAIGTPYGLQGSMTVGIISAVGRELPVEQGSTTGGSYQIPDIIQTDAAINPGNSGGVLVDDQGQVIGVTSAIQSNTGSNAGIGFVIPSAIVTKVVPSLISTGTYKHSWLGITGTSLTPDLAQAMQLSPQQRGALVEDVTAGGPSDKAGLRASQNTVTISGQNVQVGGDVIIGINQQPVHGMDDIIAYLASNTEVGQKVTLTVLRDGSQQNIDVTLGERPAASQNQQQNNLPNLAPLPTTPAGGAYLGIVPVTLTSDIAAAMKLASNQTGVLVAGVSPGTPAADAGLQAGTTPFNLNGSQINIGGDVITSIDGRSVSTADGLRSILATKQPGDVITLSILRGGSAQQVKVTLGSRPSQP
jgi:S1-C subfamily serine protease